MAQKQHLHYFWGQFSKEKWFSIKFQQNTTYSDLTFWLQNICVFNFPVFIAGFFFFFQMQIFSDLSEATLRSNDVKSTFVDLLEQLANLMFDAWRFHESQTYYFLRSYKSL